METLLKRIHVIANSNFTHKLTLLHSCLVSYVLKILHTAHQVCMVVIQTLPSSPSLHRHFISKVILPTQSPQKQERNSGGDEAQANEKRAVQMPSIFWSCYKSPPHQGKSG